VARGTVCVHRVDLLHTAAFRHAALHALLFLGIAVLLATAVIIEVRHFGAQQLHATVTGMSQRIVADPDGLLDIAELTTEIAQRIRHEPYGPDYFQLRDSQGRVLVGNLPNRQLAPGWHTLAMPPASDHSDNDDASAEVFVQRLANGSVLVVGRDRSQLVQLNEVLLSAFLIAGGIGAILTLLSGLLLSRSYLHRVEQVSENASRIIAGDLGARIAIADESDNEFGLLAHSLNTMLDRIQTLMEATRQVSSDIAHDLRTPLTHLRQKLEIALQDRSDAHGLHITIAEAITDVDAVLATFAALLSITRVEARDRQAGFTAVDLSQLLTELAGDYQPVAEERGQVLQAHIAPNISVIGDRHLLTQMFVNLIENALTHCPAQTPIELELQQKTHSAIANITDSGPGIPAAERQRVLRRFYRLDRSRATSGSGLGLALVAAITDLHGIRMQLLDHHPGLRVELLFTNPQKDRP